MLRHWFMGLYCSLVGCVHGNDQKPVVVDPALASAGAKVGTVQATDDVRIVYYELGEGPPVLLLHGYFADAKSNWFDNGIAQSLARKMRVIAIDLRGHGKSGKPIVASSYGGRMWQDVITVMDHLGLQKAHVQGYSMGGSVVTQLLYHAPDRFLSAVYGGAGIPEVSAKEKPSDPVGQDPEEEKALQVLRETVERDMFAMGAILKNAPWDADEPKRIDLTKLTMPVMAINGEYDHPVSKTQRMQREIRDFRGVVLKGKSHLTAVGAGFIPKTFEEELLAFYSKNANVRL
jgi:pimeloyl-ACP methyl ester carboxylesterase